MLTDTVFSREMAASKAGDGFLLKSDKERGHFPGGELEAWKRPMSPRANIVVFWTNSVGDAVECGQEGHGLDGSGLRLG